MTARDPDGLFEIRVAYAISSAPMRELAYRLNPLPATTFEASKLRNRDFPTVALMIDSDDLFPDSWLYIHDNKVKVVRVQNIRSWSAEMVPNLKVPALTSFISASKATGCGACLTRPWSNSPSAKCRSGVLSIPAWEIGGAVVQQEKAYPALDQRITPPDAFAACVTRALGIGARLGDAL